MLENGADIAVGWGVVSAVPDQRVADNDGIGHAGDIVKGELYPTSQKVREGFSQGLPGDWTGREQGAVNVEEDELAPRHVRFA